MYPVSSLRQRKGRNALTVSGVALSIAMVVVMLSIGQGIETSTRTLVEMTGVDIYVTPNGTHPFLQDWLYMVDGVDMARSLMEENTEIAAASPRLLENGFFLAVREDPVPGEDPEGPVFVNSNIRGVIPRMNGPFDTDGLVRGAGFSDCGDPFRDDPAFGSMNYTAWADAPGFTGEITLNARLAELLGVGPGDNVRFSTTLPSGGDSLDAWNGSAVTFTVMGVTRSRLESPGDASSVVHLSELQYILHRDGEDQINKIFVELEDGSSPDEVAAWIEDGFSRASEVSAHTQKEVLEEMFRFLDQFTAFATIIAIITISISFLFISTVLTISVRQRQTEIGVLRAIGFSRGSVMSLVVAESLVICLLGFVAGLAAGVAGNMAVEYYVGTTDWYRSIPEGVVFTQLSPPIVLQVIGLALAIGVAAGLAPALHAARMDPSEAMRRVG